MRNHHVARIGTGGSRNDVRHLDQMLHQLRAGEDGRAEFKALRLGERSVISPNTEDLAGELTAFANAEEGVVFLGVDDTGAATGIPPEKVDLGRLDLLRNTRVTVRDEDGVDRPTDTGSAFP